ncbi:B-box zinc finger family protein [Aphelenchoides avenae]|nr:B-box zinc finger family protein [Aphelenchus avenae]
MRCVIADLVAVRRRRRALGEKRGGPPPPPWLSHPSAAFRALMGLRAPAAAAIAECIPSIACRRPSAALGWSAAVVLHLRSQPFCHQRLPPTANCIPPPQLCRAALPAATMEEELRCPSCRDFLREPVLLQCAHSYCRECALRTQQKISASTAAYGPGSSGSGSAHPPLPGSHSPLSPPPCSSSSGASDTVSLCVSDPDQESDNRSVISEADSGVVIFGGGSRGTFIFL